MTTIFSGLNATTGYHKPVVDHEKCFPASLWMRISAAVISATIVSIGSAANITALIAFVKTRALWTVCNINLVMLTVNDLVITFFVCIPKIVAYWLGCWPLPRAYCYAFTWIFLSTYTSSLVLVSLIAYDRYLMVKLGVLYRQKQTVKTILLRSIPLAVILPCSSSAVLFFTSRNQLLLGPADGPADAAAISFNIRSKCLLQLEVNAVRFGFVTAAIELSPLFIMLACYISVYRRQNAWRKQQKQNSAAIFLTDFNSGHQHSIADKQRGRWQRRGAARTLNTLFAAFLLTQTPYIAVSFVISLILARVAVNLDGGYWISLHELALIFAFLNNALNPLLYAYAMPEFKRASHDVWRPVESFLCNVLLWKQKANSVPPAKQTGVGDWSPTTKKTKSVGYVDEK